MSDSTQTKPRPKTSDIIRAEARSRYEKRACQFRDDDYVDPDDRYLIRLVVACGRRKSMTKRLRMLLDEMLATLVHKYDLGVEPAMRAAGMRVK